jgi:hypothetical protein
MKNSVIARQSFVVIIITPIVYAFLVLAFFEMDNAHGEGGNFAFATIDETYTQEVDSPCKSPCPSSAEMCIEMCA